MNLSTSLPFKGLKKQGEEYSYSPRRAEPTFPTLTANPPHFSSNFSISPFAAAKSSSSSGGPLLNTLVNAEGSVTEGIETPTREVDVREEDDENGVEPLPCRGVG